MIGMYDAVQQVQVGAGNSRFILGYQWKSQLHENYDYARIFSFFCKKIKTENKTTTFVRMIYCCDGESIDDLVCELFFWVLIVLGDFVSLFHL